MTHGWRRWVRIWRRTPEADVDAEVRFHLEARVEELVAAGQPPDSARARALEEFGDLAAVRTELVSIDRRIAGQRRRADWWEGAWLDLRHVMRGLRRSPGFTVMVAATLALGIGANAVVFSLLDRLFLQPPAGVAHMDALRRLRFTVSNPRRPKPFTRGVFNYPEVRSVSEAAPAGTSVMAYVDDNVHLGSEPGTSVVTAAYVVGDYFAVLGVHPAAGRFFAPDEQRPSGLTPLAVIGYRFWQTHFAGRRDVLGDSLQIGAHWFTVIGVAPDGFTGLELGAAELWLPFNTMEGWASWSGRKADWYENPNTFSLNVVARLSGSTTGPAFAASATNALASQITQRGSTGIASVASLNGAPGEEFHEAEFSISRRLGGVAIIILIIACANVTNLLLIRALSRRRETAVRLALGVSRRRLALQFVLEAMIVAAIGGLAALLLTWWAGSALRHVLLPSVSWSGAAINTRVLLFAIAVTLVSGVAAGLVPALQGSHPRLTDALKSGVREGRITRSRTRTALLVLQAALSVVLLAGAGLFVRSLQSVEAIDLGYDANRLVFASAAPVEDDTAQVRQIAVALPDVAAQLEHAPGVERVALASRAPMSGFSIMQVFTPGQDSALTGGPFGMPTFDVVSPGYFATVGVRLDAGRGFTTADRTGAEQVAVVNRTMANLFWPGGRAVGNCIMLEKADTPCRRIVGIVSDAHVGEVIEAPSPAYYLPLAQAPPGWERAGVIVLRTRPDVAEAVRATATRQMAGAFGFRVVPRVRGMSASLAREYHKWQLGATLFSVAGALALLVAAVGIYSTIAFIVGQRRHEIGVRIALGAQSAHVARVVITQGLRVVAAGVVLGVVAALAMGKLVASLLYGVSPHDPLVLGAVAVVLILVAVTACLVPAWRAARVDPMETLRAE
ncbi:MAG TPA: ADOP family duplicated permease [Gemmatimonadaceae bacterium]|nr:ADOP family duplicated permease [Gemmatimonadaceae bacterium]